MKFSYISREKALSLGQKIPQLVSKVIVSPEEDVFIMGSTDSLMPYYVVGIVNDGKILWLSDQSYLFEAEAFLKK